MRVEVCSLSPDGKDELVGTLRLDGDGIVAEPNDSRTLRAIVVEPLYDPRTNQVYDAESEPEEFLRYLHQQYHSAYLRASKVIEDEDSRERNSLLSDWRAVHQRIQQRFTQKTPAYSAMTRKSLTVTDLAMTLTRRDGFTGEKKDKRGYRMCFDEGKRIKCQPKPKPGKAGVGAKQGPEDEAPKTTGAAGASRERQAAKPQTERKPRAPRQPKAPAPSVDDMVVALQKSRQMGLTPEMLRDTAELLGRMTVKNIREVNKRLSIKASGVKAELVKKTIERAFAAAGETERPSQKETEKPPPKPSAAILSPQADLASAIDRIRGDTGEFSNQPLAEAKRILSSPHAKEFLAAHGIHQGADKINLSSYLNDLAIGLDPEQAKKTLNERVEGSTGIVQVKPPTVQGETATRKFTDTVQSGLKGNKALSEKQRKEFSGYMTAATASMPQHVRDRIATNLDRAHFSATTKHIASDVNEDFGSLLAENNEAFQRNVLDAMTHGMSRAERAEFDAGHPTVESRAKAILDYAQAIRSNLEEMTAAGGADVAGCYNAANHGVYLSGVPGGAGSHTGRHLPETGNKAQVGAGIYSHELAHALDGPDKEYSSSPTWGRLFRSEVNPAGEHRINSYASSSPSEAFAEFGRLVYSGQVPLEQVEREFPDTSKFWKDNGLWPNQKT